jgi:hypothetical protein
MNYKFFTRTVAVSVLASVAMGLASSVSLAAADPNVAACKATGLVALQQNSKDITDLIIDQESVAVTAAETKVQDVPVSTVILGEAYIAKGSDTGKPNRFVCLLGEKGKVLLTFFTSK